jgi:hypothetical protein
LWARGGLPGLAADLLLIERQFVGVVGMFSNAP